LVSFSFALPTLLCFSCAFASSRMRKVSVASADALLPVSESVRVEVCFSFYLDFSPFLFVSPTPIMHPPLC
jgi:hypothetical protein